MTTNLADSRALRDAAEHAAAVRPNNLITIAVYDLAALWHRDREAALAIADESCRSTGNLPLRRESWPQNLT